jgi:hypothetical protein
LSAPAIDIDNQTRPAGAAFDKGADEFGASGGGPPPGPGPAGQLYLSLDSGATLGSLSVSDEDIVSFDGTSYSMFFDGSDVGVSGQDVDAFAVVNANTVLLSFDGSFDINPPGPNNTIAVDDSDILQFTGALGSATSGTFSMYFEGSDVGLTTGDEDVDAFELLSDGSLIVSTTGNFSVTGASGADEDLARCAGTFGPATSCTWSVHFDGSDVGLSNGEDVDAVAVAADGKVYLSTNGNFSVPGVSGGGEDVFVFKPSALGTSTTATYSTTLFLDGSTVNLGGYNVDGLDLP